MNTEKTIGQEIIEGLEEFAAAIKAKDHIPQEFNCRKISLNLRPHSYNPEAVKQTRALLGASQAVFARFLGVAIQTVRAWEQGKNTPQDVACRLMDEIRHNPKYWRERLLQMAVSKSAKKRVAKSQPHMAKK